MNCLANMRLVAYVLGLVGFAIWSSPRAETHTVATDGSADFDSVRVACEAAADGDTVLILPGTYNEESPEYTILYEKSVTILGVGPRPEDVVLRLKLGFLDCPQTTIEQVMVEGQSEPIYVYSSGGLEIRNCRFEENRGDRQLEYSGAIRSIGETSLRVEDSVFARNGALSALGIGGAIGGTGEIIVRRCLFVDNVATEAGGAIWTEGPDTIIEDCVFFRNVAANGAGAAVGYDARVNGCTFLSNEVTGVHGGSLLLFDAMPTEDVTQCIIAGTINGYGVVVWTADTAVCCDIWGNDLGPYLGWFDMGSSHGNFSLDPLFCDEETGDVGLLPGSPCLNHWDCDLIGAKGLGCGEVPTEQVTFGRIKILFR